MAEAKVKSEKANDGVREPIKNGETEHPVFEGLKQVSSEHDLSGMDEVKITEAVVGKRHHWWQISREDAVQVLTEIQTHGLEEVLEVARNGKKKPDQVEGEARADARASDIRVDNLPAPSIESSVPRKVYDPEKDEFVAVDPERQQLAVTLHRRLEFATLLSAMAIYEIAKNELYRELGCSTFEEYRANYTEISESQIYKYKRVAQTYGPLLPENWVLELQSTGDEDGIVKQLSGMGIESMYQLARMEEADFSELEGGKIILASGEEHSLEEYKSMTTREAKKWVDKHREYQKDLEEELNTTAQERDEALAEKEEIAKDAETGLKYKDMFGQKSDQYEAQRSRILEARSRAADLNQVLSKIVDLDPEFEALVDELRDLHKMIDRGLKRLREDNLESGAFEILTTKSEG